MFIVYALNFDCCRYVGEASSHHFDFLKRGSFFLVPSDLLQYQNGQLPPQMDMTSRNITPGPLARICLQWMEVD